MSLLETGQDPACPGLHRAAAPGRTALPSAAERCRRCQAHPAQPQLPACNSGDATGELRCAAPPARSSSCRHARAAQPQRLRTPARISRSARSPAATKGLGKARHTRHERGCRVLGTGTGWERSRGPSGVCPSCLLLLSPCKQPCLGWALPAAAPGLAQTPPRLVPEAAGAEQHREPHSLQRSC